MVLTLDENNKEKVVSVFFSIAHLPADGIAELLHLKYSTDSGEQTLQVTPGHFLKVLKKGS